MKNKTPEYCSRCKARLGDSTVSIYKNKKVHEVICYRCDQVELLENYIRSGEITTRLMMEGSMASYYVKEGHGFDGLRTEVRHIYEIYKDALLQIGRDVEEVHNKGREFEEKHWLPKLQAYYQNSPARGHSFATKDWKVLMWGSAGRVLLTFQDAKPQGKGKFGGAHVTLIFDETADYARGGVQGICATKEEALGLIQVAINGLGDMTPDKDVTLAGL